MHNDWKERLGVVFSTNPDFDYTTSAEPEPDTLPCKQQRLRVSMERAGRGGKTATLVRGFVGSKADLDDLCRQLKTRCGIGGSAKEGEIVLQGDVRTRVVELLKTLGYIQTK